MERLHFFSQRSTSQRTQRRPGAPGISRTLLLAAGCLSLGLAGACRKSETPSAPPSASDPAVTSAPPGAEVSGSAALPKEPLPPIPPVEPAGLAALDVRASVFVGQDPQPVHLAPDGVTELVPPDCRLELEMPRLSDVRIRLFDEADRLVVSSDRLEHVGHRTRYALNPAEALIAGSRYALLVEGQMDDFPGDSSGKRFAPVRFEFKTGGEKPKPVASQKQSSKKKPAGQKRKR